jgi:hypothetical protein
MTGTGADLCRMRHSGDAPSWASMLRPLPWLAAALVTLTAGCATPRSRADDAFAARRYGEAADRYEALASDAPDDGVLAARLREARIHALVARVGDVRAARAAGRAPEALRELAIVLASRGGWQLEAEPAVAAALAPELAWVRAHVTGEIGGFVKARRPAAARAVVASRRAQLRGPELASLWTALDAVLVRAGAEVCTGLDARQPYLAALVAAHCATAGVEVDGGVLPHAVGGVELDGDIEGVDAASRAALAAALERWIADSPWYARGASARATVGLDGSQRVVRTSKRTTVEVPWYERVPHAASKAVIGTGTVYGKETKTVSVVAVVPTTEYVEEERWLTYQAMRHDAEYRGDWRLAVTIGPRPRPLAVRISDRIHRTGFDHDVTHAGAGVTPTRADLPGDAAWAQHLIETLEPVWREQLAAHWRASYCEEVEYTAETAARCALGATPPPAARAALAAVLGPDVDLVLAAHGR